MSYKERLKFGDFQGEEPLIPANQNKLLMKFDKVIAHHKVQNSRLPIIVGGAHVYSPEEDLEEYLDDLSINESLNTSQSKYWTRFTSEMGNNIKHVIGQQHPYGLYFHEPNTVVLSPVSAERILKKEKSLNWKNIYQRLAKGISFGIACEMQDFTRSLFKDASDEVCQQGMVFAATTVLSTSMKRGKKPFTIKFKGEYDRESNKFTNATKEDLSAIRGMNQEIIKSNPWRSSVATSFNSHLVCDALPFVSQTLRLFDPIDFLDPTKKKSFEKALILYNSTIKENIKDIRELFHNLQGHYDKLNQGSLIALQIITAGWETGQIMRFMFLNHLEPPSNIVIPLLTREDQDIQRFLAKRFNFVFDTINPFVADLLKFNAIIKEPLIKVIKREPIKEAELKFTKSQIADVVTYLYNLNDENEKTIATIFKVDKRTVPGLMDKITPRVWAWKKVAQSLETSQKVYEYFNNHLSKKEIKCIIKILSL